MRARVEKVDVLGWNKSLGIRHIHKFPCDSKDIFWEVVSSTGKFLEGGRFIFDGIEDTTGFVLFLPVP